MVIEYSGAEADAAGADAAVVYLQIAYIRPL